MILYDLGAEVGDLQHLSVSRARMLVWPTTIVMQLRDA